jgi:hypothetical protein
MSLLDAGGSAGQLTTVVPACCGDCSATKCDAAKELARSVLPASSIIPPWLQHCRNQVYIIIVIAKSMCLLLF